MKLNSFQALFIEQLKDLYSAEKQLVKALPAMVKSATSTELRGAISKHLEETKRQESRLEQIFKSCDLPAEINKCEAMKGLIKEGKEALKAIPQVRDAAIIAAAQRIEHYEIAAYGTVRHYAKMLGLSKAVSLLEESLQEEKRADEKLNNLATEHINWRALNQTAAQNIATHHA